VPSPSEPDRISEATTVGNYFVANYPPFSCWQKEQVPAVHEVLRRPASNAPLGLYLHLPFCRKRCDFCYFKVYTDKNSDDIRRYLDGVLAELRWYAGQPYLQGREPRFLYFGGGTPSYLSVEQLRYLMSGMQSIFSWDSAEEIAFECEPGTLQESKIEALHELGMTRISLGVENFDAQILELNNRAHRAAEIYRCYEYARQVGFDQINLDLIAGMIGETEENWSRCIDETLRLAPESVTIYQMEVPYNTTIYRRMKDGGEEVAPVASWEAKRRWTGEAFARMEQQGYLIGSAYTAKKDASVQFLYRDALWTGADMLGIGVSSFGHLGGVHLQNEHRFEDYLGRVEAQEAPIFRAFELNADERLIREFVLQLKLGHVQPAYFQSKFGVDVLERFAKPLRQHEAAGYLQCSPTKIRVHRPALLHIDLLLHDFFLEEHRQVRYA
jgi:oxygen-independent coproporphyrinogen-3 oxidase